MEKLTDKSKNSSSKTKQTENKLFPESINAEDCTNDPKMLGYIKNSVDNNDVQSKQKSVDKQQLLLNGDVGKKPENQRENSIELIEKTFTFADDETASHISTENELLNSSHRVDSSSTIIPRKFSFTEDISNSSNIHNEQSKEHSGEKELLDSPLGMDTKCNKIIPNIIVPGEYDFIDDTNMTSLSIGHVLKKDSIDSVSRNSNASGSDIDSGNMSSDINSSSTKLNTVLRNSFTGTTTKCPKNIPNVVIPGNFHFIDDPSISSISRERLSSRSSIDSVFRNSNVNRGTSADKSTDGNSFSPVQVFELLPSNNSAHTNCSKDIPCVEIQGNFSFIDDRSISSVSRERLPSKNSTDSEIKGSNENERAAVSKSTDNCSTSFGCKSKILSSNDSVHMSRPKEIPSVVIPGDFNFIDDPSVSRERLPSKSSANSEFETSNEIEVSAASKSIDDYSTHADHTSKLLSPNNTQHLCYPKDVPSIVIPGDFNFIDEKNASSLSLKDKSFINGANKQLTPECHSPSKSSKSDSFILPTPASSSQMIFKIPSIYLPSNVQYIDDIGNPPDDRKFLRGERVLHSSFKIPRNHSTKRRLCRYHSDSETKTYGEVKNPKPKHHRSRSKRVKRSVSAIETNKDNYRTSVRRTLSDRSGMIIAGKHLRPPGTRYRPHSYYEGGGSSRCSSTKTLSTNVSISEIVAVEMGLKDIPGLTAKEARRRRVVCTVAVVAVTIAIVCVLLVAVTLFLSPEIDAVCKFHFYICYLFTFPSTISRDETGSVLTRTHT